MPPPGADEAKSGLYRGLGTGGREVRKTRKSGNNLALQMVVGISG
jgi:hypothetical protein